MRLPWLFRSPPFPCFSVNAEQVNVPWRLNRRRPGNPGSRQENRRFAKYSPHPWGSPLRGQRKRCSKLLPPILSSAYSFRLTGTGAVKHPCKSRPRRTSMCVAPGVRKRLSDLQPDQGIAVTASLFYGYFIALRAITFLRALHLQPIDFSAKKRYFFA